MSIDPAIPGIQQFQNLTLKIQGPGHGWDQSWKSYYSTGVQIVNCTLSSDSVLSDSTGLFNPVLSVSANEIAFDKKLANQSVSFNWC